MGFKETWPDYTHDMLELKAIAAEKDMVWKCIEELDKDKRYLLDALSFVFIELNKKDMKLFSLNERKNEINAKYEDKEKK